MTYFTRACLKNAFCKMCVTICGRFRLNEGGVAGYGNRMRVKYTAKWGLQIAEMIFQTRSSTFFLHTKACNGVSKPGKRCQFFLRLERYAPFHQVSLQLFLHSDDIIFPLFLQHFALSCPFAAVLLFLFFTDHKDECQHSSHQAAPTASRPSGRMVHKNNFVLA